jgi:hypothetical protein
VKPRRIVSGLLLIVGLGFALLGQFYFAFRREYVWDGVFLWCVAVVSFGLLLWRMGRREGRRSGWRFPAWVSEHRWRALAVIAGMWLALLVGCLAQRMRATDDFSVPLLLWLTGVACYLLAFVPSFSLREVRRRLTQWLRERRVELAGLVVLLLMASVVRTFDLEHIPANLGGDEGAQGMAALRLVGPPLGNPFSTGWFSVPTMSFLAWGLSMRLFGDGVAGLRALSALTGMATVFTTFLLARELWGRRVAWLAAMALAYSHFHVHFSRLGSNQIGDGLLVTLTLYLLMRGLRSKRPVTFALAGAVVGVGWYGYFGARLIGVIAALYLAWRAVVEYRFVARYGRLLMVLLGAALVVVAPLMFHYARYPADFAAGLNRVSILGSGWLAREQEITGRSATSLLLQQAWKSVSAFHYTLDPTFWYHASIPLLDPVSGILLVLGLVWAVAHRRWPANGLLLLWFWLAVILGWVLTENPPSSQRLVIVAPALAILVGLGLEWLVGLAQRIVNDERWLLMWNGVTAMALIVVAVLNLHYYFVVYTPTRVYGNPTAEVATVLGRTLAQRDDDYVVCFHAPPVMYWDIGNLRFMARGIEGIDVFPPGEGEPLELTLAHGARFVFLPHRLPELEAIRGRYPGGVEVPVRSSADGRLLYVLYEVAPRQ